MSEQDRYFQELDSLLGQKDTRSLLNWLDSSPADRLAVLYNRVAAHIFHANEQLKDVEQIRQQAEKFRPVMHHAIGHLIRLYVQQGELLSRQNEDIAEACKRLLKVQYKAYIVVLDHARQHKERKGLQAISIHRLMVNLLYLHIVSYIMYSAIAGKEWLNLHRLFILATQNGLLGFSVQDDACYFKKEVSVNDLYAIALLMGCASMHKLNVSSVVKVINCIIERSSLVAVSSESGNSDNDIVVDMASGSAPNFRKFFVENDKAILRYLDVQKLLESIKKQRTDDDHLFNKTGLTDDIKTHLIEAWSRYRAREERIMVDRSYQAVIGIQSIHYYLCGAQELKGFLGHSVDLAIVFNDDDPAALVEQKDSGDVWLLGVSAPRGRFVQDDVLEALSFQSHFEMDEKAGHIYPKHDIRMVDKSLHGCCLELPADAHFGITTGELVAFRDVALHSHWQVGEIAWFKIVEDKTMHAGVRLLSTQAIPVGVDVPLQYGTHKNCTQGILLAYEPELKFRTSILLAEDFFQEGEHLKVSQKGLEKDLKLISRIHLSKNYSQFTCGFYVDDHGSVKSNSP